MSKSSQLTYRGITYLSNSQTIQTTETERFARFRGLSYPIHRPINSPASEPKLLKYRGANYTTENPLISPSTSSQFSRGFSFQLMTPSISE